VRRPTAALGSSVAQGSDMVADMRALGQHRPDGTRFVAIQSDIGLAEVLVIGYVIYVAVSHDTREEMWYELFTRQR
jgi:hypothetical protein